MINFSSIDEKKFILFFHSPTFGTAPSDNNDIVVIIPYEILYLHFLMTNLDVER